MPLTPSGATEAQRDQYTKGSCHYLALALHRHLGWMIQVRLDNAEKFWEDEADADNFIPAVLHVFAIDPQGNAWDVKGVRPYEEVVVEIENEFFPEDPDYDDLNENGLKMYVGEWGGEGEDPIDRPLFDYTDQDIENAWVVAQEIFKGVPGFEVSCKPQSRPRLG